MEPVAVVEANLEQVVGDLEEALAVYKGRGRPNFHAWARAGVIFTIGNIGALNYARYRCFAAKFTTGFYMGTLPLIVEGLILVTACLVCYYLDLVREWLGMVRIPTWISIFCKGLLIVSEFSLPKLIFTLIDDQHILALPLYLVIVLWAYSWRLALDKVLHLRLAAFLLRDWLEIALQLLNLPGKVKTLIAYTVTIGIILVDMAARGLFRFRDFSFAPSVRFSHVV